MRKQLAALTNSHLAQQGHDARVDHHSLEARGIDRKPTVHFGAGGQWDAAPRHGNRSQPAYRVAGPRGDAAPARTRRRAGRA
ncbi:MAG: MobA/MobL family protein [Gemmatimonadaceae bacterium]|nr:MobA/MobL family protein [Gemmatimonadaceae bacterium]